MKTIDYNEMLYRAAEAAGRTRDNLPLAEAALLKSVFALELPRVWTGEDWDDLRQPVLAVALDANKSFANPYVVQDTSQISVTGAGSDEKNGLYYYDTGTGRWFLQNPVGTNLGPYLTVATDGTATLYDAFDSVYYTAPTVTGTWTAVTGLAPVPTAAYPASTSTTFGEVLGVFSQDPNGGTPWERLHVHRTGDTFTVTPHRTKPCAVPATVYVYYQADCPDLFALNATQLAALTLPLIFGNYLALRGAALLLSADGAAQLAGANMGMAESQLNFERTRIQRPEWAKQA